MNEKNILIVEDEMIVAMMIKLKLLDMGYKFAGHATSGEDAIRMVEEKKARSYYNRHLPERKDGWH